MVGRRVDIGILVCEYAQLLDLSTRYAGQSLALVYILYKYGSIFLGKVDTVGNNRRRHLFLAEDGTVKTLALELGYQRNVIEHVHQIYAPKRLLLQLGRDEEVFVADRIGLEEMGPCVLHQRVLYLGHHLAVAERYLLNETL